MSLLQGLTSPPILCLLSNALIQVIGDYLHMLQMSNSEAMAGFIVEHQVKANKLLSPALHLANGWFEIVYCNVSQDV